MNYYGIKSLYRIYCIGRPKFTDRYYKKNYLLIEERIVLIRAKTFDSALNAALREARSYERLSVHKNPYGQKVLTKFDGFLDAFQIDGSPKSGAELYSSIVLVKNSNEKKLTLKYRAGESDRTGNMAYRRKFSNSDLARYIKSGKR